MTKHMTNYKVEQFFNSGFVKDLVKISIFKNPDGSYILFDKYIISLKNKKYIVRSKYTYEILDFYSLQNAVTWCIFTQKNKFVDSNRILDLDKIIEGLNFSIASFKQKLQKTDKLESNIIYSCKLSQDEAKLHNILEELSSYRSQASYWQKPKLGSKS